MSLSKFKENFHIHLPVIMIMFFVTILVITGYFYFSKLKTEFNCYKKYNLKSNSEIIEKDIDSIFNSKIINEF